MPVTSVPSAPPAVQASLVPSGDQTTQAMKTTKALGSGFASTRELPVSASTMTAAHAASSSLLSQPGPSPRATWVPSGDQRAWPPPPASSRTSWLPSGFTVKVDREPTDGSHRSNKILPFGPTTFACVGPMTPTDPRMVIVVTAANTISRFISTSSSNNSASETPHASVEASVGRPERQLLLFSSSADRPRLSSHSNEEGSRFTRAADQLRSDEVLTPIGGPTKLRIRWPRARGC